jgi:hypothetical protein
MTRTDFDRIIHAYGGQQPPPGLWPHSPLTPREIPLWFAKLKGYEVTRVLEALDDLSMRDRRAAPSLTAVLEAMQARTPRPVPTPAWWSKAVTAAVQVHGINGAFAVLREQQHDSDWITCHVALQVEELTKPGQEAAYLARCRQYAAQYPADRQSWLKEIARVEQRLQQEGHPGQRHTPPPQVGSFTHVSAPRPRRNPDARD